MVIFFFLFSFLILLVQLKKVMKASKITKHHNCWVVEIGKAQGKKTCESWHGKRQKIKP